MLMLHLNAIPRLKFGMALLTIVGFLMATAPAGQEPKATATANSTKINQRVEGLLKQMTLEEKIGQLNQVSAANFLNPPNREEMIEKGQIGSFLWSVDPVQLDKYQHIAVEKSRLHIPLLFGYDVIHGFRTVFPVPIAMAASWDPQVAEKAQAFAAREARAIGINWTFGPMVDIARDARWGRIVEGAGEDPYLGASLARARVRGFQGRDYSAPDKVLACAKHWVAYGAAEAGRDYNTTDMSERTLREIYFPPFKAAVDSGVGTLMSAFNSLNGVPASANPFTLTHVLRGEWKFDGFVVSDYTAVQELINHGLAANEKEAERLALNAGVDLEMVSRAVNQHGPDLLRNGQLSQATIDEAVRRILRIKFRLGLFEHPYVDETRERSAILSPANVAAARELAARSMVLLKNERETLPLSKEVKSIALIGPLADDQQDLLGSWSGDGHASDVVTLLTGIKARVSTATKINYAKGCDINSDSTEGFDEI